MSAPWISNGEPALAFWVKIPAPEVVEVLARNGADFVVLDGEHGPYDQRTMSTMIGFAKALGLPVFVRIPGHSPADVQLALDAGVDGLLVPHVDSAEAARRVVSACRFPPLGQRSGTTASRAGDWGDLAVQDYVTRGNREVTIIAQIESPEAVDAVDEIVKVEGLDGIFLGSFDLSLTSGIPQDDPRFEAMVGRVEEAGMLVALGAVGGDAARTAELVQRGYDFVIVGADTGLLGGATRSLRTEVKQLTGAQG